MKHDENGKRYVLCKCGSKIVEHFDGYGDCVPSEGETCGACFREYMRESAERDRRQRAFLKALARPDCRTCGGAGVQYVVRPCAPCLIAEIERLRAGVRP